MSEPAHGLIVAMRRNALRLLRPTSASSRFVEPGLWVQPVGRNNRRALRRMSEPAHGSIVAMRRNALRLLRPTSASSRVVEPGLWGRMPTLLQILRCNAACGPIAPCGLAVVPLTRDTKCPQGPIARGYCYRQDRDTTEVTGKRGIRYCLPGVRSPASLVRLG